VGIKKYDSGGLLLVAAGILIVLGVLFLLSVFV